MMWTASSSRKPHSTLASGEKPSSPGPCASAPVLNGMGALLRQGNSVRELPPSPAEGRFAHSRLGGRTASELPGPPASAPGFHQASPALLAKLSPFRVFKRDARVRAHPAVNRVVRIVRALGQRVRGGLDGCSSPLPGGCHHA
jgi:hypothetical protein